MLRRIARRGGIIAGAILAVLALAAAAATVLSLFARPPENRWGPDHGRWVTLATAQAATFAAQSRPVVAASPPGAAVGPTPTTGTPALRTATPTRPIPSRSASPSAPPATPAAIAPPTGTPAPLSPTPTLPPSAATPLPPVPTPPDPPTATITPTEVPVAATATVGFRATHRIAGTLPVNLRSAPGTAAAVIALLQPGTALAATGEQEVVAGEVWLGFALVDGRTGWILNGLVVPVAP